MGWLQLILDKFKKPTVLTQSFTFIKPPRKVSRVFLHCSASDNPKHDNVETIRKWHLERKMADIGYHYYIDKAGIVHTGRPLNKIPAAQAPHNTGTIAICLGGLKNFTQEQFRALRNVCEAIDDAYEGEVTFHGHCEVSAKECPCFDYKAILKLNKHGDLGI